MLRLLQKIGSSGDRTPPRPASPGEGRRVYAIGDVHGCRDLLDRLVDAILQDNSVRGDGAEVHIVLLGDLVDRGPDSAGVVAKVMAMAERWPHLECLMGNHEEVFLSALSGEKRALRVFREMGRATLLSYGIDAELIDTGEDRALHEAMLAQVPERHRDFLAARPDSLVLGDYCFVHAGIQPGVPLEEQDGRDMRWIRRPFLRSRLQHSHMIVHGHSITAEVDQAASRIGIDTGAYASGHLTAVGLEGTDRWFLST